MKESRRNTRVVGEAQTSVDFLIGFSIFAVTLLMVIQMASGSIVNVAPDSQTAEASAERAAAFAHQNYTEGNGELLEQSYSRVRTSLKMPSRPHRHEVNVTVSEVGSRDCPLSGDCTTGSEAELPGRNGTTTRKIAGGERVAVVNGSVSVIEVKVWENATEVGG